MPIKGLEYDFFDEKLWSTNPYDFDGQVLFLKMYPETINYEKEKLILLKKENDLTKEFVKKLNYKEQEELTEDLVALTNLVNEVLTLNTMFKLLNTK